MPKPSDVSTPARLPGRWRWVALAATVAAGLFLLLPGRRHPAGESLAFPARRGPLDITVMEGGSVQALESQEVKCEVRVGYQGIKILKIVEEGYLVTDEDVRTNKVLVELDSSDFQKQVVQQDIQFETATATLTDAQQSFEIQLNQNLSDIKAAEQKARFARMDFDKFLGEDVTRKIVDRLGLDRELASEQTNAMAQAAAVIGSVGAEADPGSASETAPNRGEPSPPATSTNQAPARPEPAKSDASGTPPAPAALAIDFSQYARSEVLGVGEAKQKLRKLEDDLQVAKKELGQAQSTLEGTKRLFEKGFVTKIDLERDEIAAENSRLKVQTAETARELFLKYDFAKSAEEFLSKYAETVRELARARKAAISKLAQAQAKLRSAQSQYNIQARQRKEMHEQVDKCVMTAKKTGLVVYGGYEDMEFRGGDERMREGATVRERQTIIIIPDMARMSVRVKIHESYIKKIKKGLPARITVDAFPDKVLEGEVSKVGVLPDSQNRWLNPDMKVYLTTISISRPQDWLKPGMSAKVEIIVNRLTDVVYVPIQAVAAAEGGQFCHVANGGDPERRPVEIGEFNDEFIEIKKGLKQGERVLLRHAEAPPPEQGEKSPGQAPAEKSKAAAPAGAASPAEHKG